MLQTSNDPLAHVHFKGEGDVEFRSILFIPTVAPPGLLDNYYGDRKGLDLYVRRVFITNELEDLIPRSGRHILHMALTCSLVYCN